MRLVFLLISTLVFGTLSAQDSLTLKDFLSGVYNNHPLFGSAALNVDMAQGKLMAARGNFDPKIEYNSLSKEFKGTNYYNHSLTQLKIPVYSGIQVKAGYELNSGYYLNPELTTPTEGLFFTEISVPLLEGLLINQGRAEVMMQQAKLKQSEHELQLAQNDLVYMISSAYWEFVASNELLGLYTEAVKVAENRFDFVKKTYGLGKYAAIDTVEAYMEWQRRLSLLNEKRAAYNYTSYALSNQNWTSDSLELVKFNPSWQHVFRVDSINNMASQVQVSRHPAVMKIDEKLSAVSIDRTLQRQNILPDLTLRYKPLTQGGQGLQYSSENFTWGASFSMPLFFRKELGKLKATESKVDQVLYERMFKVQTLSNDIQAYKNAMENWQNAMIAQRLNVLSAERMLDAEKRKLELGSASIFMVNYRERYLLEAQEKLIKARKEFNKAQSAYLNKLGIDILSYL
ncbi:MAG: TolC family protein [Bacteroidia bacterium]